MKRHFAVFHDMSSRSWFSLGAVAAVLIAAAAPGELITISATCGSADGQGTSAQRSLVVVSPVYRDTPVYLAHGWQRTVVRKDGSTYTYTDLNAAGLLVRAFVWRDGDVCLANGVMLRDGRVLVDGEALDLADSPNAARLFVQNSGG